MRLVIDIPEDFYYQCKETDGKTITYLSSGMVDRAIKSGIPLYDIVDEIQKLKKENEKLKTELSWERNSNCQGAW